MLWWWLAACGKDMTPTVDSVDEADTDADADSDTDSDTDYLQDSDNCRGSGVLRTGWDGEANNTWTGETSIWVWYCRTDSIICRYAWDTEGIEPLTGCESCLFAWEYEHSNGRSEDLEACEDIFGELGEDYPLSNNSRGFAESWTSDYSGNTYEDVLMQYFSSPYFAWYGIAYATYDEGVLTFTTYNGYYYY